LLVDSGIPLLNPIVDLTTIWNESMNSNQSICFIVSLGEVLWDLFPDGNRFGGASANFACQAAMQGASVTILSAVGVDERGDEAIRILRHFGVDTSIVQRIDNTATGTVGVTMDALGKPSFVIHLNAAWDRIEWSPDFESIIARADAVYFGTLGQRSPLSQNTIRHALEIAKANGVRRVLDVNLRAPYFDNTMVRESLALASILKLSDVEFPVVAKACGIDDSSKQEDALRSLLRQFQLDLVAMTRGAHGALLVSADDTIDQPGFPVVVCDTVGAGDAFTAALTVGVCSGAFIRSVAKNACKVASSACEYPGAIPTLS
jgi:fructokinase